MRKPNWKPFVSGVVITAMLMSGTAVFAETTKSIQGIFGRITLMVNGQKVNQETLLYDGVTYVPIRAAAEALGMEVTYDGTNELAYLDPPGTNRTIGAAGGTTTAPTTPSTTTPVVEPEIDVEFLIGKILAEPEDEGMRLFYLDIEVREYVGDYIRLKNAKDQASLAAYGSMLSDRTMALSTASVNSGFSIDPKNDEIYSDYVGIYYFITQAFMWSAEAMEAEAKGDTEAATYAQSMVDAAYKEMKEMTDRIVASGAKWPSYELGAALKAHMAQLPN